LAIANCQSDRAHSLIHLVFSLRGYRLKTAFHKPSKNVCDLLIVVVWQEHRFFPFEMDDVF
ncbi:MAG: hypothetical protein QNJ53_12640, partial [Pleurocapsa sp. MO_192.B19]|nr:hypothetical protein [Pleurocapsa sp. MO_192.B19]